MADFFSEIPVLTYVSVSEFIQLSVEWIKGVSRSKVFAGNGDDNAPDLDCDYVSLGESGREFFELRRNIGVDDSFSVGFRYDLPDDQGRIWRTEAVLSNNKTDAFLTVRVTCKTTEEGAETAVPKRPYFLKLVLKAGWGAIDGSLEVSDIPRYIDGKEIDIAKQCVLGDASLLLPVVYVSAGFDDKTVVDAKKLAYDLGGVAHVVVEPSRAFSFELKESAAPNNPYGGAIGVALPGKPNVVRFTPTSDNSQFDADRLQEQLIGLLASRLTRFGTDWYSLQEEAAKAVRLRLAQSSSQDEDSLFDEWSEAFNSEIMAKDEEIAQLKNSIRALQNQKVTKMSVGSFILNEEQVQDKIPQVYQGEVTDRLSNLLNSAIQNSAGIHSDRDIYVYKAILPLLPKSNNLADLLQRIKVAGNDSKTAPKKVGEILTNIGFMRSDGGKHTKFTPPSYLVGLTQVSFGKTPSDHKAGLNIVRDTNKALGLTKLK